MNKIFLGCWLMAGLAGMGSSRAEAGIELVGPNGAAAVVVAKDALPTSTRAAEEMTNYLFKATGTAPDVMRDGAGSDYRAPRILIGTLENFPGAVPAVAKTALEKCKQFEASWTGVKDGNLYFVGKEQVGELYAVYHFIEKYLGVRWFRPATKTDPGEYVPDLRGGKVEIEPFAACREPDFEQRMLLQTCSRGEPAPNGMDTVLRQGWQPMPSCWRWNVNKMTPAMRFHDQRLNPRQRINGGGHCLFENAIPKSMFKEHPEYFALVKGERVAGHMYCMSNPEVRQRVADDLIALNRNAGGWGLGILELADYMTGNCECEGCKALDGAGGAKAGRSYRFFTVMNDIKRRIRKVQPNMQFMSYAYQNYRTLPEGVAVDPDDFILYCTHGRSMVNTIDDARYPENPRQFGEAKAWRAKVKRMGMREYMTCSHINYRPVERLLAKDLKTYRDAGFCGLWEEMVYTDSPLAGIYQKNTDVKERQESSWQYFYVGGHLLWDADLDADKLLEDAESKYYGPAYPAMKKYHALRRTVWDACRGSYGYPFPDARTPLLLGVGDTQDRLFAYLDEAEKLADGVYRTRVADDRHWLEEYWVKPHEELKVLAGKELRAPTKTADGWNAAFYADAFEEIVCGNPKPGVKIPKELETRVGFMSDADHVYIRLIAKEPHPEKMEMTTEKLDGPVWNDDGFEIFLFPPSVENAYAHIAVNAKGAVYDARCPGNDKSFNYGVTAVGKIEKDRYAIDVTIPAEHLMPIKPGDVWRVGIMRRRTVQDEFGPKKEGGRVWSLHCVPKHNAAKLLSLEMGTANCVVNGSFEDVKKNRKGEEVCTGWGKIERAEVENGHALHLSARQTVITSYFGGALKQQKTARKFRWSFRAKGTGKLSAVRAAITDTPDYTAKHHYTRVQHPSVDLVSCDLTPEWKTYSGTAETRPDAQNGIRFVLYGADAFVDDVSVVSEE